MREKKDINIEIGGNIQVAREQAGYTQDTLSEMLGMTPNHLSAIERGASGISLEALQRLCRLLGVSADRIIFGTDEPEAEALALARRISDIKPEYGVREIVLRGRFGRVAGRVAIKCGLDSMLLLRQEHRQGETRSKAIAQAPDKLVCLAPFFTWVIASLEQR